MQVLKFGGTSVGSPARMKEVREIITRDDHPKVVVLSAVSGTTNKLVALGQDLDKPDVVNATIGALREEYLAFIEELYVKPETKEQARTFLSQKFELLASFQSKQPSPHAVKTILAQGELMSTQMFTWHLEEQGISAILLPALNFMRIDKSGEPDEYYIKSMLQKEMQLAGPASIYVTQGYICRNASGDVDNLKRGGSDYTATLLGQALQAEEIQIWTDIDGMHNNDPRVVEDTHPIKHLSYDEAAELAYFGAKILHPSCVLPAQKGNTPIRLKNTMDPEASGTLISLQSNDQDVTAIAAKDGITAIKIRSGRMLMAYGFLKQIFEIFEQFETPIDMVTTSEVAVSLTIDDDTHLTPIVVALKTFGEVEVDQAQTIICIVGSFASKSAGYAGEIFTALKNIPIRMISFGGSKHNVSLLIEEPYKREALQALNQGLFG